MKTRRPRSDSAKAAVAAAQAVALGPIAPPSHVRLRAQDWPFWNAVVQTRPRDTWTDNDLVLAGNLARTNADIEALQKSIDVDGFVVEGKANPACAILDTMSRRAITLSRLLHIHAAATVGRSEDGRKAAALEREARQHADDDLIPTLSTLQ
ncbi:TPA: TerS protein [Pseudomonas aeruginosa]|nr:TerS protein [Pseudomonas aeruginosa]